MELTQSLTIFFLSCNIVYLYRMIHILDAEIHDLKRQNKKLYERRPDLYTYTE